MNTTMQVSPADSVDELAVGLGQLAARLAANDRVAAVDPDTISTWWRAVVDGAWPELGADEDLDVSLVDLCRIAEAWGRYGIPVPLLPSLLARRWCADAASMPVETPLTYALPAGDNASWVPFADFPGVRVVGWNGYPASVDTGIEMDVFAPTHPVGSAARPSILTTERITQARVLGMADAIGTAARSLDDSVEYAKTRQQFGRSIGAFQAVQHILADMHRDVEIARSLMLCAAHTGDPEVGDAAVTEGIRRSRQVVEQSIQVHGGIGFTWELDLHFRLRHVVAVGKVCAAT